MKLIIFGLSVSSSWGNGHATLWRGLIRALSRLGHRVVFFERNTPYYENHRDLTELDGGELVLYADWESVRARARLELSDAEVGMVTSYCPDAVAAGKLLLEIPGLFRVFYDLDTPVTLANLAVRQQVFYLGPRGLRDYDLALSYTGGAALDALRDVLGAPRVAPLYGSVDPEVHRRVEPEARYRSDLSYLGTFTEDRQPALERLFLVPARQAPDKRFVLGGALYPSSFPWAGNISFVRHLPPAEHPAFFSSSRLTLNITRQAMAAMGYCPSGRLFEAAACRTPVLTDCWKGIETFFQPGREIVVCNSAADVLDAIRETDQGLDRIAACAYERVMAEHTAEHRARELESILDRASRRVVEAESGKGD